MQNASGIFLSQVGYLVGVKELKKPLLCLQMLEERLEEVNELKGKIQELIQNNHRSIIVPKVINY